MSESDYGKLPSVEDNNRWKREKGASIGLIMNILLASTTTR